MIALKLKIFGNSFHIIRIKENVIYLTTLDDIYFMRIEFKLNNCLYVFNALNEFLVSFYCH